MPRADPYEYDEEDVEYWLAQMTTKDLYVVLAVVARERLRTQSRTGLCEGIKHLCHVHLFNRSTEIIRNQVLTCAGEKGLVVQFRHGENDWTRGVAEFVRPGVEPLGFVNIAAYLVFLPQLIC